jgi:hypothetical protein
MTISKTSIEEAIKTAAAVADNAPEKYQQAVFRTMLEQLIRDHNGDAKKNTETQVEKRIIEKVEGQASQSDINNILATKYDWGATNIDRLNGIRQYLAVIKLVLDEFGIDGLTAKEIQEILFQKFRISKTPNAVSMALMDAVGKYVDRIKRDKEWAYRITKTGMDLADQEKDSQ